ncbi:MAG: bifunctional hydroxymethylpyrimidine kinase/phosphomethylpyrimidine kinase [Candidatus Dormibacteria bacterium]
MSRLGATPPIVASIAASDSGAGAGLEADLKTFQALGVYGVTVTVALTAQNTLGVRAVEPVPLGFLSEQFRALDQDLRPRAVKSGMLYSAAHIRRVCEELRQRDWGPLVVDPVMVAKSGDRLLAEAAVSDLRRELLPLALVATPNWPEAATLARLPVTNEVEALAAARVLARLGPEYVVVKGGHAPAGATDLVLHRGAVTRLEGERISSRHTHGTGCTFSAAITAHLALGLEPLEAIRRARDYVRRAILEAPGLGRGNGPLQHLPLA